MTNPHIFDADCEMISPRQGFGEGILEAARVDKHVVALCADVTESAHLMPFAEKYAERYIELGVAEQNMATVASGLAATGKIPFIASYAMFSPGRNWEQIRTTIVFNNQPVKIVGLHAGLSVEADGASHQALEDIAIMRVMPNMQVVVPCDTHEAKRATLAIAKTTNPTYLRLPRAKTKVITSVHTPFIIGKAHIMTKGSDITLVACGPLVYEALLAAHKLATDKISVEVINASTIKPLDVSTIVTSAKKTGRVITLEEAQVSGGLGGAVSEAISARYPVPVVRMGVQDMFGQSGTVEQLWKAYGTNAAAVIKTAKEFMKKVRGR